jgi:acyl-CoA synthetase (AMP-forming)/AMP-acid ligase II
MVVPTMLARIIDSAEDRSVPSLRSLSYGAAPMSAALIERALGEWNRVDFVNAYGLTETNSTIALLGPVPAVHVSRGRNPTEAAGVIRGPCRGHDRRGPCARHGNRGASLFPPVGCAQRRDARVSHPDRVPRDRWSFTLSRTWTEPGHT